MISKYDIFQRADKFDDLLGQERKIHMWDKQRVVLKMYGGEVLGQDDTYITQDDGIGWVRTMCPLSNVSMCGWLLSSEFIKYCVLPIQSTDLQTKQLE